MWADSGPPPGMLARYSCIVFLKSGYDDKIVCEKKESTCKTLLVCFLKHFKMKISEVDHTNSLDPDQAQQNLWQDPKEKGL